MDLDADNDGQISPEELLTDFAGVHMRADIMLERMKLEDGLIGFIQQKLGRKVIHIVKFQKNIKNGPYLKALGCLIN